MIHLQYVSLHNDKSSFLARHITLRADMIKYIHNDKLTEVQTDTATDFLKSTALVIFSNIPELSFLLVDKYISNQNKEVAIKCTEVLIKKR